jgi:hypothetical protein
MWLNGLNGWQSGLNSSLSPHCLMNLHILSNLLRTTHYSACVPFLSLTIRFVCKSSPNSKLPRALFFFFLSFLCGGCRLNSSSSSSCYGLLLLLFPSLKYATLSCKFSFSTSIQKPQQLINVSLFLFPPPPNLALIIFCSRRISVAYMYVSKTRVERMLRIL